MISLIICTYNRAKYIGSTLERVAANVFPTDGYEIVLVDNNSTDGTAAICGAFPESHPEVNYRYFLETSQGLSYARNRGIREAAGDVLVFLDDDSFIGPDYLRALDTELAAHPEAAAFGGCIHPLFENGREPDWLCKWTYSWVSAIDMGPEARQFTSKYPIGANMGFRRSTIDKCGDFNTSLGRTLKNLMGGEEKDIFARVRARGLQIWYFPDVVVDHVIPESRTTRDYIIRFAKGVGLSERLRCKSAGSGTYLKRLFSEAVKWGATIVLWVKYLFQGRPQCGNMLALFRWHVTGGLLGIKSE